MTPKSSTAEMKRDFFEPERYEYLSKEDSDLFDKYKDDPDERAKLIIEMIKAKRSMCEYQQSQSKY